MEGPRSAAALGAARERDDCLHHTTGERVGGVPAAPPEGEAGGIILPLPGGGSLRNQLLRNIAIIAHVDHGKTTLVDAMLRQGHVFRDNQTVAERVMDSLDQERERGITIVSKNTAVFYYPGQERDERAAGPGARRREPVKINIVDTPGHADFGGEVERVMGMVDGVLLLVDAVEGPMPQTRFVTQKALRAGHRAIVVVNKIDRGDARPDHVIDATFDLFVQLGADDRQLDFPIVYTNAIAGTSTLDSARPGRDLRPLFDAIVEHIPAPQGDGEASLAMLVSSLDYDEYRGRIAIGRIYAGTLRPNQQVTYITRQDEHRAGRVVSVFVFDGLRRVETPVAQAGEIVAVTGIADVNIGETLTDRDNPNPLPMPPVDEPTLRMTFAVNTSPFAGREGQYSTSRKLRERLVRELETNVSLRMQETESPDAFLISGRGELHLAVLIEAMRREGYELQVSQPEVIYREVDGVLCEPVEEATVDVAEEYMGSVIEQLGQRRGEMQDMAAPGDGTVHLVYRVPTRGLLGFRSEFITMTRGTGILNTLFAGYRPLAGEIAVERSGSLIATEPGTATAFGLHNAEARGALFIAPGVAVYEGMIVGRHQRESDLEVNVCKAKHLTNMRSSTSDIAVRLTPHVVMTLDRAIEYIGPDELVEVTPKSVRMRKRILGTEQRRKAEKRQEAARA
ncbi:MAG: translational GTPase TypA [Chthonomonadales bacterium]|nr:translational GTPase TypA [Chthonomonadales bacterium]